MGCVHVDALFFFFFLCTGNTHPWRSHSSSSSTAATCTAVNSSSGGGRSSAVSTTLRLSPLRRSLMSQPYYCHQGLLPLFQASLSSLPDVGGRWDLSTTRTNSNISECSTHSAHSSCRCIVTLTSPNRIHSSTFFLFLLSFFLCLGTLAHSSSESGPPFRFSMFSLTFFSVPTMMSPHPTPKSAWHYRECRAVHICVL